MEIMYYDKVKRTKTETPNENTIEWNHESLADLREYAFNSKDKSLELIMEVGQVPYLKHYALDTNGERYAYYLATPDENGVYQPDTSDMNPKALLKAKGEAEQRIKDGFIESFQNGKFMSTVLGIEVDNRRYNEKNDLQNLTNEIAEGEFPIAWKGVSEFANIANAPDGATLQSEMRADGRAKFANKWTKEQAIADLFDLEGDAITPTKASDYDAITW
jgi:hypothetical protein